MAIMQMLLGGAAPLPSGTGGSVLDNGGYRYHRFTGAGNFVIAGDPIENADYIIVGGGARCGTCGKSGDPYYYLTQPMGTTNRPMSNLWTGYAGGGGAIKITNVTLAPGTYPITVGAGASGQTSGSWGHGSPGSNSTFNGQTARGGGGGALLGQGSVGGSGGGGHQAVGGTGGAGTAGQGQKGGNGTSPTPGGQAFHNGGGGGGSNGVGGNSANTAYGYGNITGGSGQTFFYYTQQLGRGAYSQGSAPRANGPQYSGAGAGANQNGMIGIVIIRYPI